MCKRVFAGLSLRRLGLQILASSIGAGVAAAIVWLFNALKWPVFLVLAFCLLGIAGCSYVAFSQEARKRGEKRKWRYRRWRSWALVGLVTFSIIGAGTVTYWLTTGAAVSTSELADLLARGHAAYGKGSYEEALNYYKQALVISREVGHRAGEGTTLNNIGLVYCGQGQYDQALEYCKQALVIFREVGDRAGEGTTLHNIGLVYRSQGLYDQALEYYKQALVISREVGNRAGEGATLDNIGGVYEPPRDCRRVQSLRGWSHDKNK
ncbi:tetratricopeptide repeat protein [Candidatus Bipolaricaulota bacterium]|nr:tetratricopeptide repeat protein [Candidatus Bipolaricaulota bacterium]